MAATIKDLGKVTAYAYAKAAGYTGTEEQFQAIFDEFTENAPGLIDRIDTAVARAEAAVTNIDATIQDAVDDAVDEATASAVATANQAVADAQAAQTAAEGAVTQANAAVTQANAAVTAAQAAQSAAEDAAESFVIDRTLTDSGAAAPADLVGDLKESITQRLDLFCSYKNVKIINKSATGTTRFYPYSFVANKTYLVINDTAASATFRTKDGNTSDASSIDQPFGQRLPSGASEEFTASADASYFETYNNGAGRIIIAEKIDEDPILDAIENLGKYGLINARTYYKGATTTSFQYQYNFTSGKTYAVINRTTSSITFQTRLTPDGSKLDDVGQIAVNQIKTFIATADAKWFNSYSTGAGNILVGEISEAENTLFVKADDIFNAEPYTGNYDWQTPVVSYGALFKGKANVESFAFFTDPHVMGSGDDSRNEEKMKNYFKRVQKAFNATACSFLVCGGDLLNNSTTMDEACYRLGYIKGIFDNLLDKCKLVLGNHDTNYQGKLDASSNNGTGRLTNSTLASILYRDTDTKKAYYSFDGSNSKCYVLDSGIEHNTMLEYDWEQVAWLAGKLAEDDPAHAIMFLHIIVSGGSVQTNATNFGDLVEAYNSHTTITLNSTTYDFTSCTGHVDFWVAGHTHADSTGTLGGIPYFITASNSFNSDVPLIDLVLVDYDNSTVYLKRVGGIGSDRTINLT